MRFVALLLAALAIADSAAITSRAHAEAGARTRPYAFQLGIAWVEPISATRDRFSSGFGLSLGATLRPLPALGAQLAYSASLFDLRSGVMPGAAIEGAQLLQSWSASVVVTPLQGARAGFYVLGGAGLHQRRVDVTAVRADGVAAVCDAWLLACFDGANDAGVLLGSRGELDFGVHGGVGTTFAIDPRVRLYLEARFEFIWGEDLRAPAGTISRANSEYVPITLGVDF